MGTTYKVFDVDPLNEDYSDDFYYNVDSLEEELRNSSYDFYMSSDPYAGQLVVLVVADKYVSGASFDEFEALCADFGLSITMR